MMLRFQLDVERRSLYIQEDEPLACKLGLDFCFSCSWMHGAASHTPCYHKHNRSYEHCPDIVTSGGTMFLTSFTHHSVSDAFSSNTSSLMARWVSSRILTPAVLVPNVPKSEAVLLVNGYGRTLVLGRFGQDPGKQCKWYGQRTRSSTGMGNDPSLVDV